MAVDFQVTRFQKTSTSTNGTTQDLSLNFTPKAIIVFSSDTLAGNDDTFNEGIYASYGFSDGTNQACWSIASEDAQATSDTGGSHRADSVFARQNTTTPATVLIRASCAFITNGVRFTWDVNTVDTPWIYVVAFGGSDITNVKVNTVDIGTTGTGTADYTGLGFTPVAGESILFTLENNTVNTNSDESICSPSIGCAVSSTKRWVLTNTMEDGRPTTDTWFYYSPSRCLASLVDTTGAVDYLADFNGWITDGFQLDIEDGSASSTNKFSYMVINGGKWDVGNTTLPASPGSDTVTVDSALATMRGACMVNFLSTTVDTAAATSRFGMAVTDGTTSGWMSYIERDNLADSQNISRHSAGRFNAGVNMGASSPFTPSMGIDSTFTSFGTNTFTTNYSVVAALSSGWWAVGETGFTLFERSITESSISVSDSNTRLLNANRTLSESSISVSDANARVLTAPRSISEGSISVSDTNVRILTANRSLSEASITVSDTLARILTAFRTISEASISISDTGSDGYFLASRSIDEDPIEISDSNTRLLLAQRSISEPSITVSDSLTRLLIAVRSILEDTILVSDTGSDGYFLTSRSITEDAIDVSDTLTRILYASRPISEPSISVSDDLVRTIIRVRTITEDPISVSETLDRTIIRVRFVDEAAIDVSDSLERLLIAVRTIDEDAIDISDALARILYAFRTISESSISVSDVLTRTELITRTLAETVTVSDALARIGYYNRAISESVSVSETVARILTIVRTISETVTVSDALARILLANRAISESSISVSDSVVRRLIILRPISEASITVSDAVSTDETKLRTISETVVVSDSLVRRLSAFRILSEPSISVSDLIVGSIVAPILAEYITDPGYTNPVRFRITWKSKLGDTTADESGDQIIYYQYDSFVPEARPFDILDFSIRLTQGEISTTSCTINDFREQISDPRLIGKKSIVEVEFKKELGRDWERILTGIVRNVRTLRPANKALMYQITIKSKQAIYAERVANFKRAAKRSSVDSIEALTTDAKMKTNALFKEVHTATDIFPKRNSPTIQQTGEFDLETGSISDEVTDFITEIAPGLTTASETLNQLTEGTGSLWGVDVYGNPYLRYPTEVHSGIVIKDDPQDLDSALNTSVNMASFEFEDITDVAEGFGNRLYVLNSKDTQSTASSSKASGFTTLTTRWIAQSFIATDNNITSAAFILSTTGNPTNTAGTIKGVLRASSSNGIFPTGPTLATFEISFSQISHAKDTIFVNDIKTKEGVIVPGQKYWWVLQGTGLFDDTHTVNWHHDNDMATAGRPKSGVLPLVDADPTTPGNQFNWVINDAGPVYSFSTFSSINHILVQSDPESIAENGLIEQVVNLPAFNDDATYQKVLVKILKYSAKEKRIYDITKVTIPTAKLFRPGELVTVVDSKSKLDMHKSINAEIVEVSYNFDVNSNALGCKYVALRLVGFIDPVISNYLDNHEC